MQCMSFRSHSAPSQEWSEYLHQVQSVHCPYLTESRRRELSSFSIYASDSDRNTLQDLNLGIAIVHAEIVRAFYLHAEEPAVQRLCCENILLRFTAIPSEHLLVIIHWTHWALKALYTEAGLAFGKFWPNEQSLTATGVLIPDPPDAFISIRPTIIKPDSRFFSRSKTLAKKHRESSKVAVTTFEALDSRALRDLRRDLEETPRLAHSLDFVIEMANKLAYENLLKRMLAVDGLASVLS